MCDIFIHLDGTVREIWEIKLLCMTCKCVLKIVHLRNGHILIMLVTIHE